MSHKQKWTVFAVMAVVLTVLSACVAPAAAPAAPAAPAAEAPAAAAPAEAAPAASGEALKIAFSVPGMSFPFFVHMEKLFREEADKLGGIEVLTLDGQDDTTKQVADVEAAIAQGVAGIVISPREADALQPAIQEAIDAGIPVVTVDRRVEGATGLLAHVGAENVLGGEAQGNAITSLFPDGAKIIELLGTPGSSPAIDRSKGLHNVIDPVTAIQVVCQQTAEFNRAKGLSVTENCLTANPDAQAIVAANDDMALGAVEAASAAGFTGPILGYDALPESLQAIDAGKMYGTVEQFPGGQASQALDILVSFLRDGTKPAEDLVLLTPVLITKDNLSTAERASEAGIK